MSKLDQLTIILSVSGIVASLLGVLIGLFTLYKVRKVEEAQRSTSKVTQELLGVDNIESDYTKMIMFLSNSSEESARSLQTDMGVKLGTIKGIRRVLSSTGLGDESITVKLKTGYFTNDFITENIEGSLTKLDIITGRAKMISTFAIMEKIRLACERGVKVRLITLCENACLTTLEDALKTVAFPAPANAEEYKSDLETCRADIISCVTLWNERAQKNFSYVTNKNVPRISYVRCDDYISLGFLQLFRDAQPKYTADREYIKISISSSTGKVLNNHFDCVWDSDESQILFQTEN